MFNLRAARASSSTDSILVSMNKRPQTEFRCFIASGIELFLRQQHLRPSNAACSKDLDQIGARFFLFSNKRANLFRCAGLIAAAQEWFRGSENSRTGQSSFCDRIA